MRERSGPNRLVLPEGVSRSSRVESREMRTGRGFPARSGHAVGILADRQIKAGGRRGRGHRRRAGSGPGHRRSLRSDRRYAACCPCACGAGTQKPPPGAGQTHPLLDRIPVLQVYRGTGHCALSWRWTRCVGGEGNRADIPSAGLPGAKALEPCPLTAPCSL